MENIVQAVEGAISAVETEAKKGKTEVVSEGKKVEETCEHVAECIKCHALYVLQHAPEDLTPAQKEAEDEAHAVDGAFMRFVRRMWEAV